MASNVELVRSIYEDWLRGDMALEKFDSKIAMIESQALPGGGASAYGIDAVRRYMQTFAKYWEEIRFEPQEYIEAGEQVVVVARLIGRGKASGVEVQRTWAYVWTVRGSKALRMQGYEDRQQALQAAGLTQ